MVRLNLYARPHLKLLPNKITFSFSFLRPATAASLARKGTAMGSGLVPSLTLDLGQIVNRDCVECF